jgi:predicted unusual protein kinase regulating ubiquinone biosynthesis (AarF/ABC1/UbiB family)
MGLWLPVAALLALGGALALALYRSRLRHRLHRTASATRLSSRAAARWVAHRARSVGRDDAERARLQAAFHLRTAEDVAATMGAMKGAMMKLAQMLSYVDLGLPEAYREVLASLQADAPPMAARLAAAVVCEELGRPPAETFAWFDPEPLAAASIGQVHAARLRDGREVVVKVQYPGVADAMRADLDNVDFMTRLVRLVFPALDPQPFVAELRARLAEELDYRVELKNQQRFLALYRGHPFIRVPEVVPELSTRRVLTMERAEGLPWREALAAPADIRDVWGEVVYRYVFGTFYREGLFNGDPHPGNYRFCADGSVVFLDYGCVKTFTPTMLADVRRVVLASLDGDALRLRAELVGQGFLAAGDDADPEQVLTWLRIGYEPILRREPFTITRGYAERSVRANVDPSGEWGWLQKRFNMPADYLLLNRINLGLISVLAGLRPTRTWRAIVDEFWDGAPPATELGRLDAAFRARHAA